MSTDERDELAHEIAEENSKSVLESMLTSATDNQGGSWLDSSNPAEHCDFFVERAIRYLEAEGILKRCPDNPQLVGWDEMDEVEP